MKTRNWGKPDLVELEMKGKSGALKSIYNYKPNFINSAKNVNFALKMAKQFYNNLLKPTSNIYWSQRENHIKVH